MFIRGIILSKKEGNIFFPNTTQVPNFVFDVLMYECASHPVRFFVLCAIVRKTYGWQKEEDTLSLSQIMLLTGKDKKSVKTALAYWSKKGIIKLLSKGFGRKSSKYRILLFDYIERHTNAPLEGAPLPLTELIITPLEGAPLPPQKQLNQLPKSIIQNTITLQLPEKLKEFAKENNLVYSSNVRIERDTHSKMVTELSIDDNKLLEHIEKLKPILKDTKQDWWTKSNGFGFKFMMSNWDRINSWHNQNKPRVVNFKQPEKKEPAKFSSTDLEALKEFLA